MKRHLAATRALTRLLGKKLVKTDEDSLIAASFDGSKLAFKPEAVITPKKTEDISKALKLANKYKELVICARVGLEFENEQKCIDLVYEKLFQKN